MGITDNLIKSWVIYHYGTPFGQILGVATPRHPSVPRIAAYKIINVHL